MAPELVVGTNGANGDSDVTETAATLAGSEVTSGATGFMAGPACLARRILDALHEILSDRACPYP
jgi:hypothetical protein